MKNINILLFLCFLLSLPSCKEDTIGYTGAGTITGRVVEAGTFTPIENAKVALSPTNNTVFTDAEGYFVFEKIETGDYSVSSTKDGFLTSFKPATVTADLEVNVIFEMEIETAGNRPPTTPVLISPEENAEEIDLSTTLVWSSNDPENDTIYYKISIKNDRNNDVFEVDGITDTTYLLTNLVNGTKYFWQVSATDRINDEVWSATHSFTTTSINKNRFLYVRNVKGNNVIYSANEAGEETALTSVNDNCWRPRKNVTTNQIAFLKSEDFETHLFVMNTDGSNVSRVTSLSVKGFKDSEIDFAWSTDGSQLLYPNFNKLYAVNKDGSNLRLVHETKNGNFISECDWSNDGQIIALKTNDAHGYNISIYTIDNNGNEIETIISEISGAAGGINLSVDNSMLLYTRDVSGFENTHYRQLDTRMFVYYFDSKTTDDISEDKKSGTIDFDARFSPDEAEVIFVNTTNDGGNEKVIYTQRLNPKNDAGDNSYQREVLFENAFMPDWE